MKKIIISKDELLKLINDNLTISQATVVLQVSTSTIYRACTLYSVQFKTKSGEFYEKPASIKNKYCEYCNSDFKPSTNKTRFCSRKCLFDNKHKVNSPNLILDYFKIIDTKQKAYWLGFLFADGCVYNSTYSIRLSLFISIADESWLNKFINDVEANLDKKIYSHRNNDGIYKQVGIFIRNKIFVNNLVNKGCVPRKTAVKRFPKCLVDISLAKSFLLGYSDGNGAVVFNKNTTLGASVLTCGSLNFLKDVKEKFNVKNKIMYPGKNYFRLNIGAHLYNDLVINYNDSLPRKRCYSEKVKWYENNFK
jgi:hypothetical protein